MNISSIGQVAGAATGVLQPGRGAANVAAEGGDFGAVLADVAGSAKSALQRAEAASMAALQGKGDTREVVEAVMQAEQSLQTAIAVRDKLVAAFQEITRMSI